MPPSDNIPADDPSADDDHAQSSAAANDPGDDLLAADHVGPGDQSIEATSQGSPLPFEGLEAPAPLTTDPPTVARWMAFAFILIGGLLGGMIGYGTADVMGGNDLVVGLSAILGALIGAVGVGIVAGLTLRAMNEWRAVQHPEAESPNDPIRIRRAERN